MKSYVRIVTACVIVAFSILFAGCPALNNPSAKPKIDQPGPQQPGGKKTANRLNSLFPLTKGSTWKYQGEGNEYASFSREVLFTKGNLAQVREDNGGTVSAAIYETTDLAVTRIFFQGEAYDRDNLLNQQPNETKIILKEPLVVGTTWGEPGGQRQIVDVNATVDTPAGEFANCIKVEIAGEHSTLFEYFKEGVGMVKREFIDKESGNRITSSLEAYNLGKKIKD